MVRFMDAAGNRLCVYTRDKADLQLVLGLRSEVELGDSAATYTSIGHSAACWTRVSL